ncbi:hypothetical protein IE53DRAFT_383064 [Violaceomyces palustris]|uniref:Uncharacterized protein n=1 Tax=Violaceomyces palustris TaxID=1673888 RepID=A0ACD0P884_9BASI|nr:hypothetical protein IE53DRAFT_383064 [Violaceomyces palustris]
MDEITGQELGFLSLPIDLLVPILSQLQHRVKDLASSSLVSKTFNRAATPLLYENLFLRDQTRLRLVFRTLASNRELASYVKVIELRVFPFGLSAEQLEKLEVDITKALLQATSLNQLCWTRTGSLNDRLLPALLSPRGLESLEITGDSRTWSPSLLIQRLPTQLRNLSIILPDRRVVNSLVDIVTKLSSTVSTSEPQESQVKGSEGLKSLSILAQHSPLLTDAHIKAMAPHLGHLQRLSLVGCRAVTGEGILSLLRSSSESGIQPAGIQELALEGLNVSASSLSSMRPYLASLRLFSITYPRSSSSGGSGSRLCNSQGAAEFYHHLEELVRDAPKLEEFTHYAGAGSLPALGEDEDEQDDVGYEEGGVAQSGLDLVENGEASRDGATLRNPSPQIHIRPTIPTLAWNLLRSLTDHRGGRLKKLRFYGVGISLDQLELISRSCRSLEDLVIQIWEDDVPKLQRILASIPKLTSVHVLSHLSSGAELVESDVREIAQSCVDANTERLSRWSSNGKEEVGGECRMEPGSGLRQIGFRNRVWLVDRKLVRVGSEGKEKVSLSGPEEEVERKEGSRGPCDHLGWKWEVGLKRWDPSAGQFPEVLLVVRA